LTETVASLTPTFSPTCSPGALECQLTDRAEHVAHFVVLAIRPKTVGQRMHHGPLATGRSTTVSKIRPVFLSILSILKILSILYHSPQPSSSPDQSPGIAAGGVG
jgi:hypothetical protein